MNGHHQGRRYRVGERGTYPVTVTAAEAAAGTVLLKGPLRLMGWSFTSTASVTLEASNSVVAPAANATIAQVTGLVAGDYQVSWTVALEGPAAAGDADNFKLVAGGSTVLTSDNLPVAGEYPQETVVVNVGAGGTIRVAAVAIGTAGVTYRAQLVVQQLSGGALGQVLDAAQLAGNTATGADQIDTQLMADDGVYIGTSIAVLTTFGSLSGVVYVRDVIWVDEEEEPSQPSSSPPRS